MASNSSAARARPVRACVLAMLLLLVALLGTPRTALAQTGTLSPGSMDFGDQIVDTVSTQTLTISNTSLTAFTVTSISITASAFQVAAVGSCGTTSRFTVPASSSCTVPVEFRPVALGDRAATLTVTAAGIAFTPASVSLSGFGIPKTGTVSAGSTDFGNQTIDTTSAPRDVTITNTSPAVIRISSISFDNARFTVTSTPTCGAGLDLAVGASCTVTVTFRPTTTTPQTGVLTITGTSTVFSPASLSFTGTGLLKTGTLASAAPDFGNQTIDTTSAPRDVTITNTSPAVIRISSISFDNARFTVTSTPTCGAGLDLAVGASCTVSVTFRPTTTMPQTATLTVTGTSTIFTPLTLGFTGVGTPVPLVFAPDLLDFGTVVRLEPSPPQFVSIANAANEGSVTVNSLSMSNARFSLVAGGSCGATPFALDAGESCTLAVSFRPDAVAPTSGMLAVGTTTPVSESSPSHVILVGEGLPDEVFRDGFEQP
jgi:hypothetical protein